MTFLWRRNKNKQKQQQNQDILMMESNTFGMTVIEENSFDNLEMKALTAEQWVEIISAKSLQGYSYRQIFFSFLKGIPQFLRFKIWLLLCTENNSKNYKFSSKMASEEQSIEIDLKQFSTDIYEKLINAQPQQKQTQQIDKDIHRSYSNKQSYKYTAPLLKKILYALSNSGVEYTQGMNYILLNIIIYCLQSVGITQDKMEFITYELQKDIFIILRETVLRMNEVFGNNNIFKVVGELEQKLAESCPQVLFQICKVGMDCFSMFSQNYYSVMSYNDPPDELCKQMMDLFFLEGEKAIHAMIIKMIQLNRDYICTLKDPQQLQSFLKKQIFHSYYKVFVKEKENAKRLKDFGLSFYDNVEQF